MKRVLILLVAAVVVLPAVLASLGCGRTDRPLETLTVAVASLGTSPQIGPFSAGGRSDKALWGYMADWLLYEERDGSGFIPSLAESWEISPDDTMITFELRQGIQFQDGWGELTSEDVKYTIDTILTDGFPESRTFLGAIMERIETEGPYRFTMYLKGGWANDALAYLAPSSQMGVAITSRAYTEEVGLEQARLAPVFSGPYTLAEYAVGDKLVMEAVEDHWRVVPEFNTMVIREVPELMTRIAMVSTGEADIAEISPAQAQVMSAAGGRVVSLSGVNYLTLLLWGQWHDYRASYDPECPFLDVRVREAMSLAIDREAIAQYVCAGFAAPSVSYRNVPGAESLEPLAYDPARAKQLLAEAGYSEGFEVPMWLYEWAGVAYPGDVMMAVAGYWQAIGLRPSIIPANIMGVYSQISTRNTTGVVGCHGGMGFITPTGGSQPLRSFYDPAARQFPMAEDAQMDVFVERSKTLASRQDDTELAIEWNRYVRENYIILPIVEVHKCWAVGEKVGNWEPVHPYYLWLEYATQKKPLGTFRLFEP